MYKIVESCHDMIRRKTMKKILFMLCFLLFITPIQAIESGVIENVEVESCNSQTIQIRITNKLYKLSLFNTLIIDKTAAYKYICNELNKSVVTIEIDPLVNNYDNVLDAWVFVDGELLQSKLVEKRVAKPASLNKNYKYTDKMIVSDKSVIAIQNDYEIKKDINKRGIYFLIGLLICGCLCYIVIIILGRKAHNGKETTRGINSFWKKRKAEKTRT